MANWITTWCEGIRQGRNYVGDGKSHLMEFEVGGQKMGAGDGTLRLASAGKVKAVAKVAALLQEQPDRRITNLLRHRHPTARGAKGPIGPSSAGALGAAAMSQSSWW